MKEYFFKLLWNELDLFSFDCLHRYVAQRFVTSFNGFGHSHKSLRHHYRFNWCATFITNRNIMTIRLFFHKGSALNKKVNGFFARLFWFKSLKRPGTGFQSAWTTLRAS